MSDTAPATGETTTTTTHPLGSPRNPLPDTGSGYEGATEEVDWQAEAEKWKTQARKHEERAKANATAAKELEQLRQSSMTDQEKAVEQARQEARAATLLEVAKDRVDDAVKVAAAGRNVDVDALLDGLDRSRFVTDDGQPDTDAIGAWVDRIAPKPDDTTPVFPDLSQGARGSTSLPLNGDPLMNAVKDKLGIRR